MQKKSFLLILCLPFIACNKENLENTQSNVSQNTSITQLSFEEKKINLQDPLEGVFFDGVPFYEFSKINNIDAASFQDLVKGKILELDYLKKQSLFSKSNPSLEEIRDAMINECENSYCCGLDDACAVAVKIAYHIKKLTS